MLLRLKAMSVAVAVSVEASRQRDCIVPVTTCHCMKYANRVSKTGAYVHLQNVLGYL